MTRINCIAPLLCLALLGACSSEAPPPREEDRALERAIQEPQDKARAVEDQLEQARRAQDEKLREQGG
jgi:hypothetical protein